MTMLLIATPQQTSSQPRTQTRSDVTASDSLGVSFDQTATTEELLESAREMFIAKRYPLSEMLYKSILIREPDNIGAMLELSVVYEAMGKLQYARGLLTRASILSPYDEEIIKRTNEVVKRMAEELRAEVDSLVARGAFEQALPKLSLLLTTQPENANLHFKKAQCYIKLSRPDAAIEELDKALTLSNDERFHRLRTEAQQMLDARDARGMENQARALLADPTPANREKALSLVTRILDAEPDNEWAQDQFRLLATDEEGPRGPGAMDRLSAGWPAVKRFSARAWSVTLRVVGSLNGHMSVLLVLLIVLVLLNSPLTHVLARGFSPRHMLSGQLSKFSFPEVLAFINAHGVSGHLKIRAEDAKGSVYFNEGELYHCKCGKLEGREALKRLLKKSTTGYFVFTPSLRSTRKTIDTPLSLILLDLPARDKATKASSVKKQTKMKALLQGKS